MKQKTFGREQISTFCVALFFVGYGWMANDWKGAAFVAALIVALAAHIRYVQPVIDRWKKRHYEQDWKRKQAEAGALDAFLDTEEHAARSRLAARQELRQSVTTPTDAE